MSQEFAIVADTTTHDIAQLPTPAQDYIRAFEAQVSVLNERIQLLEEQFRLAQSKRFAPTVLVDHFSRKIVMRRKIGRWGKAKQANICLIKGS